MSLDAVIKILIGLIIGALCGVIPLLYGFFKHDLIIGILGILASIGTAITFYCMNKSPFIAIAVSLMFVLIIVVKNKNDMHHEHDSEFEGDEHEDHSEQYHHPKNS